MKKAILTLLVVFMGIGVANAQAFAGKGSDELSVGIAAGFNTYDHIGLQANYNVGVHDFVSVGGQVNMWFSDFNVYVGPRANFHILNCINPSTTSNFDVYLSATMGLRFGDKTQFTGGGYVGAKYQINDTWCIKAEVGSNPMLGVIIRL
ncbi:MAG: hypothetical protein II371_04360 [Flavobacteriales bacterium]|jgi:hypothetical protein|nr:hypothetical protein [Flavobacteriales bacterium]MBQ1968806.1 hypothetical protein [Flavobacteriales bacterium]MBQ5814736.1 hypothetical protein [Flavobacteriales bacterium]